MSVAKDLRELAQSTRVSADEAAQLAELADLVAASEAAKTAVPVGSDLSLFIKNISLLGFVPALKQFILDIFNIK
jgi:hypothetical protein